MARLFDMYRVLSKGILLCLFFWGSNETLASEVYKYQDENGNWQFSDVSAGAENERAIRIEDSREKKIYENVWVRERTDGDPSLVIVNNYHGPVEARIQVDCSGCEITSKTNTLVVPAYGEALATRLEPVSAKWQAEYNLAVVLGDPEAEHDHDFLYQLPFQEFVPYQITQSFNGRYSHTGDQSLHAIDIAMPIASPILAARGGKVMAIKEDHTEAGLSPEYADKANTIYILHSDGTIGVYAHLDMFSALVEPGDIVEKGSYIGRSGNTGFSSGPHLHFTVWKNDKGVQKTVPFQFDDGLGQGFVPHAGEKIEYGFMEVEKEVTPELHGLYQESVELMARLNEAQSASSEDDGVINSITKTGLGLWEKAKNILD